ncbi:hypothetical protein GKZ90_0023650 [Flavobacterium sp. MC2016-06]|uniref:hypothetical protein n=1 Tax=Flavobacterium sp. MC2016-06 TaxID=2676308 RepID=UPI0012BAE13E|nr:hypothetical protein [Flavobacterium sp. MC2016-06]MBU3861798.1 hypothetical protein [Flavobacterium sp. MC2016-06]
MIVLDKNKLENEVLIEEAASLKKAGFIAKEQFDFIKKELHILKRNKNILVRLGFFLLGSFLYSSLCGVVALLGLSGIDNMWKIFPYIFAIIGVVGSEILAKQDYHNHGLDDAFILGVQLNVGFAFGVLSDGVSILSILIAVTITSFIMYLRYVHLLSALVFYLVLTALLGYAIFEYLEAGQAILPFFMMLYSIAVYFFSRKLLKIIIESFYHDGLLLIKSLSLILMYCAGNYMVVRELSAILSDGYFDVSPEIPFAIFFWIFTFGIPVLYLFFGLKNKDRIMLWISFLAIAFSFYTFRFYYSVLPIEVALTLGGLVLFAIAYFSIQKLKNKESGITFKPDRINNSDSLLNAEALIVASAFGMKPEVKGPESPMEFGGGGFSGGGSEGSF